MSRMELASILPGEKTKDEIQLWRAEQEFHDIAEGRYDGRIQKYQQGMSR